MSHTQLLHAALLDVRLEVEEGDGAPLGICALVESALPGITDDPWDYRAVMRHMRVLFQEWPEFSGSADYPVPASGEFLDPMGAFVGTMAMWDTGTEYGRARHRLLRFLIDQTAPTSASL